MSGSWVSAVSNVEVSAVLAVPTPVLVVLMAVSAVPRITPVDVNPVAVTPVSPVDELLRPVVLSPVSPLVVVAIS